MFEIRNVPLDTGTILGPSYHRREPKRDSEGQAGAESGVCRSILQSGLLGPFYD